MRGFQQLLLALDGAGAGHHLDFFAAHDDAAGVDGGVLWVRLAADELVALLNRRDGLNLRPGG